MEQILIIEDDPDISGIVAYNLEREGYKVDIAADGEEGLLTFTAHSYDLVLLDIMIPKLSGLEVLDTIRSCSDLPVLIMSARTTEEDRLAGLARMADDYICKPFSVKELLARIKVHTSRYQKQKGENKELLFGDLRINEEQMTAVKNNQTIPLSKKELQLLLLFARNRGRVYKREELLRLIWGYRQVTAEDRTVDVAIRRLREKIEDDPAAPCYIISKRGVGYLAGDLQ